MQVVPVLALLGVVAALRLERHAKEDPKQPVFYMTAMSKLAGKHQTRLWLQSLRRNGKWKGDAVMVTDKPNCLVKNIGEEFLGGAKLSENNDVVVYPGGEGMGKVYILKKPTTTNVMEMKKQKALAWNNIRQIGLNPSYIIWTDQDIVFGRDVDTIIQKVNSFQPGHTLALFRDIGGAVGQLHTGIIFMFPGAAAEACLASWGEIMLKQPGGQHYKGFAKTEDLNSLTQEQQEQLQAEEMGPDQMALGKTEKCRVGTGIAMLPTSHLMLPTPLSMGNGKTATFIHFTNTKRWKQISVSSRSKYFTTIGLAKMDYEGFEETCEA